MAPTKPPVCTAELVMLAHARLPPAQRPPCSDLHLVWLLVGQEVGDQLSKRRGVRLEGLGDLILTVDGIRLIKGGHLRGARPAHPLNLASIAKAAASRHVSSSAASRDGVARCVRAVIGELQRLAQRRRLASLALRPVGSVCSRKARSETEEGVDLLVEDGFQCSTALAWDKNLLNSGQPFGSRTRGFRQDDRCRSRAAVEPPAYRGRGKACKPQETVDAAKAAAFVRARAYERHGPDGLSLVARCLGAVGLVQGGAVDTIILKNALEDAGVASTAEERRVLLSDPSVRGVEKAMAHANALSCERRLIIDEAWAELRQRHHERELARRKGARKDGGGIEEHVVAVALLKQRVDGDWHPAVKSGRAPEEAVVARLLAFLDVDEAACTTCSRSQFRAALARLSASFASDDDFDAAVKSCWKLEASSKPFVAPARKERPPRPVTVAWPSPPPAEEAEEEAPVTGFYADDDETYEGLPSRVAIEALEELCLLVYAPVCDATEFRRRLGGPPDEVGLEDLSRRLRRRAVSTDLAVSARRASCLAGVAVEAGGSNVDAVHAALAALFGRDKSTLQRNRRPLANASSASLRKALLDVDPDALMEADAFVERFQQHRLPCQARHVRAAVAAACRASGLPRPAAALGERDWASPATLLELCRGGAMTARRALLVERAFAILTRRLGTDTPPASKLASALPNAPVALAPPPPTRALFLEAVGGPRQRVDCNTFRAFFEDLSPAIEGDAAFARLLANAWDVAAWPASGEDVAEDEVPEPDADDDGQRGPVEDRYYTSSRQ